MPPLVAPRPPLEPSPAPSADYRVEVDRLTAAEWSDASARFEDATLYQTWAYGAVRWGERSVSHLVLKRGNEIVALAQLRIVRPRRVKAGIAHLRWGPMVQLKGAELNPEIVRRMADALYQEYAVNRGLYLRLLPNAQLETPRGQVFQSAFARFTSEPFAPGESYRTILVDLTQPLDVIRKKLDQKWRNQLNRAEKNNLVIREAEGAEGFAEFKKLYDAMWERKQFSGSSDVQEFERIHTMLPPAQRMKVLICEHEGVPAAGVVATGIGNMGIYLLGATNEQGLKSKGAYLLQWRVIEWLKANGVRYYNLGGINPKTNPGVYHFKSGFNGQDVLYVTPLVACENLASKVFARTAGLLRGRIRTTLNKLFRRG